MNAAPKEFDDHIYHITGLAALVESESLHVQILDAIERLVAGMNGPWHGCFVYWKWGDAPDTPAALFDGS